VAYPRPAMRFVLHYRGPLKANGKPPHKHDLRKHFHRQLATLWGQRPLSTSGLRDPAEEGRFSSIRPTGAFNFVPLLTEQLRIRSVSPVADSGGSSR
jgi:hypothetical protein